MKLQLTVKAERHEVSAGLSYGAAIGHAEAKAKAEGKAAEAFEPGIENRRAVFNEWLDGMLLRAYQHGYRRGRIDGRYEAGGDDSC